MRVAIVEEDAPALCLASHPAGNRDFWLESPHVNATTRRPVELGERRAKQRGCRSKGRRGDPAAALMKGMNLEKTHLCVIWDDAACLETAFFNDSRDLRCS